METPTTQQSRPLCELLPPLILGTATFNTQYVADPLQMPYRRIVSRALELGVTAFDTSPYYGPSEILLGDALAAAQANGVPRESYAIVTKAGRIAPRVFDYSPEHIRSSVRRSLERLHTPYLDLVYLHDVEFVSPREVLEAVCELRRMAPAVRAVGISGFPVLVLCELAEMVLRETGVPLDAVLSYGHFTVQNCSLARSEVMGIDNDSSPVRRLKAAGVDVVLNASMLNMGLLTSMGIPPDPEADSSGSPLAKWHPSPPALRLACKTLAEKAALAGERLEAVAIRWSLYEWARVGALAGVGIQLPGMPQGATVGGSVMGVTSVDELEETVREWEGVLEAMDAHNSNSSSTSMASSASKEKIDGTSRLVRDVLWPALGEWQDYSWASPEPGFVNERVVQRSSI
ncbi:Aldo/keto reductase [Apiospora phragmitis]|uniref:Aldo/keto reductase n=1 Tax=Apiospora phragmitis TaxID=2905665 RepID=A0ABR1VWT9_9PEZI